MFRQKSFNIYIPSPASLYDYKELYSTNFINNKFETYNLKKNMKKYEHIRKLRNKSKIY